MTKAMLLKFKKCKKTEINNLAEEYQSRLEKQDCRRPVRIFESWQVWSSATKSFNLQLIERAGGFHRPFGR
jgi:hypothetical protein